MVGRASAAWKSRGSAFIFDLGRRAISAGRRRLNGDGLASFEHGGVAALKLLQPPVLSPNPVLADLTRLQYLYLRNTAATDTSTLAHLTELGIKR